ncbi:MAG: MarR family transcriptional regulator [Candidatus Babeliales bacterium]
MIKKIDFKHISVYQKPEESPGLLLWRVSTQWRYAIENTLKPLGLTHPQFVILATTAWLTKNGDVVSQVDIGRMADLDPNTTSQILRGLEKKNLITRLHSEDEKHKNPVLTSQGTQMLTEAMPAVERSDSAFFSQLTETELRMLIATFQKLHK